MQILDPIHHIIAETKKYFPAGVADSAIEIFAVKTFARFEERGRLATDYFLSEELFYDEDKFTTSVRLVWVKYPRG